MIYTANTVSKEGFILYVCSSMSTKTGLAPQKLIASAVAIKVLGTVITSWPLPIPRAKRDSHRASVPLPTPMAYSHWQNEANSFSNCVTNGPPAKAVLSMTCFIANSISSRIESTKDLDFADNFSIPQPEGGRWVRLKDLCNGLGFPAAPIHL